MAVSHPHCVVYGDSGAGKSTFAATWPKPMIVFSFDPFGKETPYLKRGDVKSMDEDANGTPRNAVISRKTGELLIQIEYYLDADPASPEAYSRFLKRMPTFYRECGEWATVVVDSVTFMEIMARKLQQYRLNPSTKDPRQWFASSTDQLEEMLMIRLGSLPINVVVCAHVDEDKDEVHGFMLRNPAAPGRMRKRMGAGFTELYHAYVTFDEQGERIYRLQTRSDNLFSAATQIDAPDPCEPTYAALWMGAR